MIGFDNKNIGSAYIGNRKIAKAYLGDKLVFDSTKPQLPDMEVGNVVNWAGYKWIVVHDNGDGTVVLAMSEIYSVGRYYMESYSTGQLATVAKAFENSLPASALEQAVDTTVEKVTAKIFAASYAQMNGGFKYFSTNSSRICNYNGSPRAYYTSTVVVAATWFNKIVTTSGGFQEYAASANVQYGFRPFVTLKKP